MGGAQGSALRDAVRSDRDGRAPHLDQIDGYRITGIALELHLHTQFDHAIDGQAEERCGVLGVA